MSLYQRHHNQFISRNRKLRPLHVITRGTHPRHRLRKPTRNVTTDIQGGTKSGVNNRLRHHSETNSTPVVHPTRNPLVRHRPVQAVRNSGVPYVHPRLPPVHDCPVRNPEVHHTNLHRHRHPTRQIVGRSVTDTVLVTVIVTFPLVD